MMEKTSSTFPSRKHEKQAEFAKEALELALNMAALFEPFADGTPEFQRLKDKISQLKERLSL